MKLKRTFIPAFITSFIPQYSIRDCSFSVEDGADLDLGSTFVFSRPTFNWPSLTGSLSLSLFLSAFDARLERA